MDSPNPPPAAFQQTTAAWKDWLMRLPLKNSRLRTSMPIVLEAGPGTTSTVAGVNGTAVSTEPRVTTVTHFARLRLVTTVYWPVAGLKELVRLDPRLICRDAPCGQQESEDPMAHVIAPFLRSAFRWRSVRATRKRNCPHRRSYGASRGSI